MVHHSTGDHLHSRCACNAHFLLHCQAEYLTSWCNPLIYNILYCVHNILAVHFVTEAWFSPLWQKSYTMKFRLTKINPWILYRFIKLIVHLLAEPSVQVHVPSAALSFEPIQMSDVVLKYKQIFYMNIRFAYSFTTQF